jgi:DhnA family fructose-bisphosphate aldolase class Ia
VESEYELTRDRIRAHSGPFTPEEQLKAELELAVLHADAFALCLRAREGENPPTLEEWGTHYRRKAPLLVRLTLSDPLRYEDMAREAVTQWREAEQREATAIAAIGTGEDAEQWLASRDH